MAHPESVPRRIDIAATTTEALTMEGDAFVVIDCLRATTTIAVLFAGGITRLWATADIETARRTTAERNALLLGEVGGLPPEGFDYGNSPVEAQSAPVQGREAVLFTTNGTVALTALAGHGEVMAAAPANATAVLRALEPFDHIVFVCAGSAAGRQFALEDFAAAAYLVQRLPQHAPDVLLGDLAMLGAMTPDPLRLIALGHHAEVVRSLGLAHDVEFAARVDTSDAVARLTAFEDGIALLERC